MKDFEKVNLEDIYKVLERIAEALERIAAIQEKKSEREGDYY